MGVIDQIRERLDAVPFRPFRVRFTDGDAVTVESPGAVEILRYTTSAVVLRGWWVYLVEIDSIEPAADPATTAELVDDDEHWPDDEDLPAAGGGV
jgi:hypothetical protein